MRLQVQKLRLEIESIAANHTSFCRFKIRHLSFSDDCKAISESYSFTALNADSSVNMVLPPSVSGGYFL